MDTAAAQSRSRGGFALITAVVVSGFVGLLVVYLNLLISLSSRTEAESKNNLLTEKNVDLAIGLAVAQLQRELGKDSTLNMKAKGLFYPESKKWDKTKTNGAEWMLAINSKPAKRYSGVFKDDNTGTVPAGNALSSYQALTGANALVASQESGYATLGVQPYDPIGAANPLLVPIRNTILVPTGLQDVNAYKEIPQGAYQYTIEEGETTLLTRTSGGFKRELKSFLKEILNNPSKSYSTVRAEEDGGTLDTAVKWRQLADFYMLGHGITTLSPRFYTNSQVGVYPIIYRYSIGFSAHVEHYHPDKDDMNKEPILGSGKFGERSPYGVPRDLFYQMQDNPRVFPLASDPKKVHPFGMKHIVGMALSPMVVLWNPYNIKLQATNFLITFGTEDGQGLQLNWAMDRGPQRYENTSWNGYKEEQGSRNLKDLSPQKPNDKGLTFRINMEAVGLKPGELRAFTVALEEKSYDGEYPYPTEVYGYPNMDSLRESEFAPPSAAQFNSLVSNANISGNLKEEVGVILIFLGEYTWPTDIESIGGELPNKAPRRAGSRVINPRVPLYIIPMGLDYNYDAFHPLTRDGKTFNTGRGAAAVEEPYTFIPRQLVSTDSYSYLPSYIYTVKTQDDNDVMTKRYLPRNLMANTPAANTQVFPWGGEELLLQSQMLIRSGASTMAGSGRPLSNLSTRSEVLNLFGDNFITSYHGAVLAMLATDFSDPPLGNNPFIGFYKSGQLSKPLPASIGSWENLKVKKGAWYTNSASTTMAPINDPYVNFGSGRYLYKVLKPGTRTYDSATKKSTLNLSSIFPAHVLSTLGLEERKEKEKEVEDLANETSRPSEGKFTDFLGYLKKTWKHPASTEAGVLINTPAFYLDLDNFVYYRYGEEGAGKTTASPLTVTLWPDNINATRYYQRIKGLRRTAYSFYGNKEDYTKSAPYLDLDISVADLKKEYENYYLDNQFYTKDSKSAGLPHYRIPPYTAAGRPYPLPRRDGINSAFHKNSSEEFFAGNIADRSLYSGDSRAKTTAGDPLQVFAFAGVLSRPVLRSHYHPRSMLWKYHYEVSLPWSKFLFTPQHGRMGFVFSRTNIVGPTIDASKSQAWEGGALTPFVGPYTAAPISTTQGTAQGFNLGTTRRKYSQVSSGSGPSSYSSYATNIRVDYLWTYADIFMSYFYPHMRRADTFLHMPTSASLATPPLKEIARTLPLQNGWTRMRHLDFKHHKFAPDFDYYVTYPNGFPQTNEERPIGIPLNFPLKNDRLTDEKVLYEFPRSYWTENNFVNRDILEAISKDESKFYGMIFALPDLVMRDKADQFLSVKAPFYRDEIHSERPIEGIGGFVQNYNSDAVQTGWDSIACPLRPTAVSVPNEMPRLKASSNIVRFKNHNNGPLLSHNSRIYIYDVPFHELAFDRLEYWWHQWPEDNYSKEMIYPSYIMNRVGLLDQMEVALSWFSDYDLNATGAHQPIQNSQGSKAVVLFEIPQGSTDLHSIAQLQSFNPRVGNALGTNDENEWKFPTYTIGNSWLPINSSSANLDYCYVFNKALWDNYFVLNEELTSNSLYARAAASFYDPPESSANEGALYVQNSMNINSVEPQMWNDFIGNGRRIKGAHKSLLKAKAYTGLTSTQRQRRDLFGSRHTPIISLPRFIKTIDDAYVDNRYHTDMHRYYYTGYRSISTEERNALVEHLVDIIGKTAPYFYVHEFINRHTGNTIASDISNAPLGLTYQGILQYAINKAGINDIATVLERGQKPYREDLGQKPINFRQLTFKAHALGVPPNVADVAAAALGTDYTVTVKDTPGSSDKLVIAEKLLFSDNDGLFLIPDKANPQHILPYTMGAPGYLNQADLISSARKNLHYRTDEFFITATGQFSEGRLRKRVRVFRTAKFVDTSESADTWPPTVSSNQKFGRRFKIISIEIIPDR